MEDILWKYSWANLTMLMLSIPKYDKDKNEKEDKDGHVVKDISQLGGYL